MGECVCYREACTGAVWGGPARVPPQDGGASLSPRPARPSTNNSQSSTHRHQAAHGFHVVLHRGHREVLNVSLWLDSELLHDINQICLPPVHSKVRVKHQSESLIYLPFSQRTRSPRLCIPYICAPSGCRGDIWSPLTPSWPRVGA